MQAEKQRTRHYIDVPYREREQAKALGAIWAGEVKSWYVPSGTNPAALGKWKPHNPRRTPRATAKPDLTPQEQFAKFIRDLGIDLKGAGKDPSNRAGSYCAHHDPQTNGYFGWACNHATGDGTQKWFARTKDYKPNRSWSSKWQSHGGNTERQQGTKGAQRRPSSPFYSTERKAEIVANIKQVRSRWSKSPLATQQNNEYLRKKGIDGHGCRLARNGRLVVPMVRYRTGADLPDLQSVQFVGRVKKFCPGIPVDRCMHIVGGADRVASAEVIVVTEGSLAD